VGAGAAAGRVGCAGRGAAVAACAVWAAGPGRPGLIEPMGVHAEHRGHGYGRGITLAGAAALRERGASSVRVCTPSSLTGEVATYRAAGLVPGPERTDGRRAGWPSARTAAGRGRLPTPPRRPPRHLQTMPWVGACGKAPSAGENPATCRAGCRADD